MSISNRFFATAIAAGALVFGVAIAQDATQSAQQTHTQQEIQRKTNVLRALPGLGHAADTLDQINAKANQLKQDEKIAEPDSDGTDLDSLPMHGMPGPGGQAPDGQAQAGAPGSPAPNPGAGKDGFGWRLEGTVAGDHGPIAVFDTGKEQPLMLQAGSQVDQDTKVVQVTNGFVEVETKDGVVSVSPW